MTDGDIIIGTKLEDSEFQSGLNKLGGLAAKGAAAIVAAIGAASVAVVSLGSKFESANAAASTLFGDANVDMNKYSANMVALSTRTGIAAEELGKTMYDALSAGIPASDDMSQAMSFLEKNTRLAKAGFTDINTATIATAKVLNAYKMDVAETDRVHKVLMQTQNLGIVTVNELGSVLAQVTPTASAMSVSFEQVGASLASMTAQGTPAAQATTQLNQLIAELGKSGTKANDGFKAATEGSEYAGKSFQDLMKEGVPLNEILDLMDSNAQRNGLSMLDMFSSIEAGKAALAISGQNSKQYADNLKAMGTEIDVVGKAYDKVTNTFEAKSGKVINSFKNIGIAAYDKFKEPLSKAMDSAQKSVDELSKSLSGGKMDKSIDKIADGFGKLLEVTISLASKAIPVLLGGFAFVVDHGALVATAIAGISAALFIYNNYQTITNGLQIISAGLQSAGAIASLAYGTAQAVMAGEITFATGAMEIFNMVLLANPIGLAIAGIVGLTVAIGALAMFTGEEKTRAQELNETLKEEAEAIKETHKAAKEKAEDSVVEIDRLKNYKSELDNIVDANGKVRAGYEDRANYLANELANATGKDIKLVDGQIQNYQELSKAIDDTIEKMRAEAILEAHKEEYTKAIENQKTAYKQLSEANDTYNKNKKKNDEDYQKYNELYLKATGDKAKEYYHALMMGAADANRINKENLDLAQKNYDDHTKTIVSFEQAKTDIIKGEYAKVNDTVNSSSSVYEKDIKKKKQLLDQEASELSAHIDSLKGTRTEANKATVDAQIASDEKLLLEKRLGLFALQNEVWASTPGYENAYKVLSEMGASAFETNGDLTPAARTKVDNARLSTLELAPGYAEALSSMANNGQAVFDSEGELTTAAQKKLVETYTKMNGLAPEYSKILTDMANAGEMVFDVNGNLTNATQKKLVDSYSQVNKLTPKYKQALIDMANNGEEVFDKNGNLTEAAKKKIDDAKKGASDKQDEFNKTLKSVADSGKKEINDADTNSAGANFVIGAKKGVENNQSGFLNIVKSMAGGALNAITSIWNIHSPSRAASWLSEMLVAGLTKGAEDNEDKFIGAVGDIGNEAVSTLEGALSKMDTIKLDEMVNTMKNAVANNNMKFEQTSKIRAEYAMGKTIEQLNSFNKSFKGKLEAVIENHVNIDGRETAIVLAPFISEEIGFE